MFLPNDKNDRAMFVTIVTLVGLGGYVWLDLGTSATISTATSNYRSTSISVSSPKPVSAQLASMPPLPPRGPVPHAHTVDKIVKADGVISIVRDPTDIPPPIGRRPPMRVRVDFETIEVIGKLADGATYRYWTFNQKVPGPFVRVRVGDTVEVRLKNDADSTVAHNVDLHAVTGPGGGAIATEAAPGNTARGFEFRPLNPGLYVYHCAVPLAAQHIANGMYGMILVEPEEGLAKVDREYYVMQGEIYTEAKFGTPGEQVESYEKLIDERPEYFVFNGAAGALMAEKPLRAKVGETVRIFFGVGGPNYTSSFHLIGEIFDSVYVFGSVTSQPLTNVQTVSVPPGGTAIAEFKLEVPGKLLLVDHALSRVARGLIGVLEVEGSPNANVYKDYDPAASAQSVSH